MENVDTTRVTKTKILLENIKHDLTHAQKVTPYRSAKSSLEKKLISKLLADSEINIKLNFKEELRKLIFSALNFNDIPRAILQISIFMHYEIAHLIVHEKDSPLLLIILESLIRALRPPLLRPRSLTLFLI